MNPSGRLVLAGTPIGSKRDASPALREALQNADVVAAEDTRQFAALLRRLELSIPAKVVSYFEENETSRTEYLLELMRSGATVVQVTDAGMPSISDPGFRLVAACIRADIPITAVPGPSAVTTALALSGLPSDRFCFEGFVPRKSGQRRSRFTELSAETRTMVFFEAPHRLDAWLSDAAKIFGSSRPAAICRELTKPHEEVIRGTLDELIEWAENGVRGEITIVLAGAVPQQPSVTDAVDAVMRRISAGDKMSAAVSEIAAEHGVNRKQLYQAVLDERTE